MPEESTRPRAFRLAYDGRPFAGFQRQPDVHTVEEALFEALDALGVSEDVPAGYSAAGRTDAGVSALGQTIALQAPDWLTPRAFNGELPDGIRVWAMADVATDFHATHDPSQRTYVYHLHAPSATTDDRTVRTATERLSGEHDFHNLTPDTAGTVRDLTLTVTREGEFLVVTVRAGGFPRHLVRKIVGLLDAVGRDTAGMDRVDRILGPQPVEGPAGVPTAPARGLVLRTVTYPGLTFSVDERAATDAHEVFTTRRTVHATRARVAEALADGITDEGSA